MEPQENLPDSNKGEDMDLGDLDLHSIATACKQQNHGSIREQQMQPLKEALIQNQIFHEKVPQAKPKNPNPTSSLGIKVSSSLPPKIPSEDKKKKGRRSNKQLLTDLSEYLVNSGHIALVTNKFFPTPPPHLPHQSYILECTWL